jgi:ferritin
MTGEYIEYTKLIDLLNKSDPTEIYEELIKKEDKVLDTINRVVNVSNEKDTKSKEFLNLSFNDIIHKFFWNISLIFSEITHIQTIQDIPKVLFKNDRKIYVGLLLVLLSIFIFFIVISS